MAALRLFAAARLHRETAHDDVPASTVAEAMDHAVARYGLEFAEVLGTWVVWLNGEATSPGDPVGHNDEIAVLPPVSGGSR